MENFEVMLSEKGKRLLVVNNFKFKFGRLLKSGETYWRCTKNTCKCSVYTVENDTVIIKSNLQHNHEDAPEKLNRQRISNTVKRKAIEDCNEKPSKLIRQEISTAKHILTVADIALIRRNLYNAKRTVIPPLPNSIDEVHDFLSSIIVETNKSESFLLVNEKEKNIIIFACETNLKLLCSCDVVYMDGTFTYCTKFFCQLFTIHGLKNNNYVPLVFCLLKSKHQATYFDTLLTLVECCAEKGLTFKPQKVVIDFELAIHNALKQIWSDLSIIGCRFHLSQSWS